MAKTLSQIESLARNYTEQAIETLARIMREPRAPHAARVKASEVLLNRGWGAAKVTAEAVIEHRYVIEAPAQLTGEAWQEKYGEMHETDNFQGRH